MKEKVDKHENNNAERSDVSQILNSLQKKAVPLKKCLCPPEVISLLIWKYKELLASQKYYFCLEVIWKSVNEKKNKSRGYMCHKLAGFL